MLFILWNYLKQYWWLVLAAICFIVGYHVRGLQDKSFELTQQVAQQQIQIMSQKNTIKVNNQNVADMNNSAIVLHNKLSNIQSLYQTKQKELQNVKDKLNSTNHINIMLVRAMGATQTSTSIMSKDAAPTSRNVNNLANVPADRVASWTLGLKQDDDYCHEIHNATIKLYNQEMELINKNN